VRQSISERSVLARAASPREEALRPAAAGAVSSQPVVCKGGREGGMEEEKGEDGGWVETREGREGSEGGRAGGRVDGRGGKGGREDVPLSICR